jgi:hypothetical protein
MSDAKSKKQAEANGRTCGCCLGNLIGIYFTHVCLWYLFGISNWWASIFLAIFAGSIMIPVSFILWIADLNGVKMPIFDKKANTAVVKTVNYTPMFVNRKITG